MHSKPCASKGTGGSFVSRRAFLCPQDPFQVPLSPHPAMGSGMEMGFLVHSEPPSHPSMRHFLPGGVQTTPHSLLRAQPRKGSVEGSRGPETQTLPSAAPSDSGQKSVRTRRPRSGTGAVLRPPRISGEVHGHLGRHRRQTLHLKVSVEAQRRGTNQGDFCKLYEGAGQGGPTAGRVPEAGGSYPEGLLPLNRGNVWPSPAALPIAVAQS